MASAKRRGTSPRTVKNTSKTKAITKPSKPASKKSIPKKQSKKRVPTAQSEGARLLRQQTKQLEELRKQLSKATGVSKRSKKPETIKQWTKQAKKLATEEKKHYRQFKKTAKQVAKLFTGKKRVPKSVTTAKSIVTKTDKKVKQQKQAAVKKVAVVRQPKISTLKEGVYDLTARQERFKKTYQYGQDEPSDLLAANEFLVMEYGDSYSRGFYKTFKQVYNALRGTESAPKYIPIALHDAGLQGVTSLDDVDIKRYVNGVTPDWKHFREKQQTENQIKHHEKELKRLRRKNK